MRVCACIRACPRVSESACDSVRASACMRVRACVCEESMRPSVRESLRVRAWPDSTGRDDCASCAGTEGRGSVSTLGAGGRRQAAHRMPFLSISCAAISIFALSTRSVRTAVGGIIGGVRSCSVCACVHACDVGVACVCVRRLCARKQGRKRVHPSDLRGAGRHTAADGTGCTRGLGCRMCSPCPAAEFT